MSSKIAFQTKQLVGHLNITDASSQSIDRVIDNLLLQNREYQRKPQGLFRKIVTDTLNSIDWTFNEISPENDVSAVSDVNQELKTSTSFGRAVSLNSSLTSLYHGVPSKRVGVIQTSDPSENQVSSSPSSVPSLLLDPSTSPALSSSVSNEKDRLSQNRVGEADRTDKKETEGERARERKGSKRKRGRPEAGSDSAKERERQGSGRGDAVNNSDGVDDEIESAVLKKKSSSGDMSFRQLRPTNRLSDLAGLDSVITQVQEMVFHPAYYPRLHRHLGVCPPSGLLLHGPSGCGKTTLARAIAGELGWSFYKASGPELIGGTSGESEERIRELFTEAMAAAPSVVFLDSLDVIAGKRESSQRGMDRRVVAQLLDSMDNIAEFISKGVIGSDMSTAEEKEENEKGMSTIRRENTVMSTDTEREERECEGDAEEENRLVILIAATNRPDALDPAVRGRFHRELTLPVPDATARTDILRLISGSIRLADDVDLVVLGKNTPGFVGADLKALIREAGVFAVTRILQRARTSRKDEEREREREGERGEMCCSRD